MGLYNAGLLGWLSLGAIPILIYLWNQRRYRRVEWAAMEFLLRALRRNRRRLRLENVLLLLVRTALCLLFALALARPHLAGAAASLPVATASRRNVILLVDRSYSMAYRSGATSAFDRARAFAEGVITKALGPGDRVALAFFSDAVQEALPEPVDVAGPHREALLAALGEAEPLGEGTDVARTLAWCRRLADLFDLGGADPGVEVADADRVPKTVVLITDLQRSGWYETADPAGAAPGAPGAPGAEPPPHRDDRRGGSAVDPRLAGVVAALRERRGSVVVVDVGEEEPRNLAVTELAVREGVIGSGEPLRLDVRAVSWSDRPEPDLVLTLHVDGRKAEPRRLGLEPGETRVESFHAVLGEPGPHRISVELASDPLTVDNERFLAVEVRDRVEVMVVDGERSAEVWGGETDYLRAALAAGPRGAHGSPLIRTELAHELALTEPIRGVDVLVLANVVSLTAEQVGRVEAYVAGGGALLVFLGDQVDRDAWNDQLHRGGEGVMPLRLVAVAGDPDRRTARSLEPVDVDRPPFAFFKPEEYRAVLLGSKVFQYYASELSAGRPGDAEGPRVLARWSDGSGAPAVVESRLGRGRVMVCTTSCDDEWSHLPAQWPYQVLMEDMVLYLADTGRATRNLAVGEEYVRLLGQDEYAREVTVVAPGGDLFPTRLAEVASGEAPPTGGGPVAPRFRLHYADTGRAGLYEVLYRGGVEGDTGTRQDWFAVNLRTGEGDLGRAGTEELDLALGGAAFRWLRGDEVDPGRLFEAGEADPSGGGDLWRTLMAVVLGLLSLEAGMAWWFGRHERR
ncbi:MAG: BatA domain-containing protein [Planctomycetes bacterium]|nr:BatA domain-containing protein [Planctomycetota bacterium]